MFGFYRELFYYFLFAYRNGHLLSFSVTVWRYLVSKVYNILSKIRLYCKLYKTYWSTSFDHWPVQIENIPDELQYLILEYAATFCHCCGSTIFLTNICRYQTTCTCISCIEICLEHNDVCCKCCGQWGKIDPHKPLLGWLAWWKIKILRS